MEEEIIIVPSEEVEIIEDISEYKTNLSGHFDHIPEIASPLIREAKAVFSKIKKSLSSAPAFINAVKAVVPTETLQAVLTDEQKQKIAKGALKLMTKKKTVHFWQPLLIRKQKKSRRDPVKIG